MVLDNAKHHHANILKEFLDANPNIIQEFLPPNSTGLNTIESVENHKIKGYS